MFSTFCADKICVSGLPIVFVNGFPTIKFSIISTNLNRPTIAYSGSLANSAIGADGFITVLLNSDPITAVFLGTIIGNISWNSPTPTTILDCPTKLSSSCRAAYLIVFHGLSGLEPRSGSSLSSIPSVATYFTLEFAPHDLYSKNFSRANSNSIGGAGSGRGAGVVKTLIFNTWPGSPIDIGIVFKSSKSP